MGGNKSSFDRYNARVNLVNTLSDKLNLSSVFLFTHEKRKALPENGIGSVLYNTINAFPNRPIIGPDGNYEYLVEVSDIINPVAQIANTHNEALVNKLVGKQEFSYKFNDNLTFNNRLNYNYASVEASSAALAAFFASLAFFFASLSWRLLALSIAA